MHMQDTSSLFCSALACDASLQGAAKKLQSHFSERGVRGRWNPACLAFQALVHYEVFFFFSSRPLPG